MAKSKQPKEGAGDAPQKKEDPKVKIIKKGKKEPAVVEEEVFKTDSQIAREEAEYRALMRKQRFKRKWPEITRVKLHTRPWHPPPPPRKLPPIVIDLPELQTRKWVPPYRRRRRQRRKLLRIPAEEITQPLYEGAKLKRIWHQFTQVERNKMMLQGSIGCNSKRYSSTHCGSQTACVAVVCCGLLSLKNSSQLVRRDVDDVIENGDTYYRQCMLALKCYKGKPALALNQLNQSFFLHDVKFTIKIAELEKGILEKLKDDTGPDVELMTMMQKKIGSTYMLILSVRDKYFLIWGNPPPPEAGSSCRTVCYILDPHMLNEIGQPDKLSGAGAFLRYAGVNSFVTDFVANYGHPEFYKTGKPKTPITLTSIEIVQMEPLIREITYDLDLNALKIHCASEWHSMNVNALIDRKKHGEYPLASLSAVSLATSRSMKKKRGYVPPPKEPPQTLPVAPERAPVMTNEQVMQLRGENFFLYCPKTDAHTYGRDDMIPLPKSETILHSPVDIADQNFHSQFQQLDVEKWVLRGTRHFASFRYQKFRWYTGIPCTVFAIAMLRRLRARAWNEDTVDETLDGGYNLYRESLVERAGPIRRLVLGELKETFAIRDRQFKHKEKGIAVWGKIISNNPKVLDLCRGIEAFFKESDTGLLQVPGEFEVGIWNEGGKFYVYHPWPADRYGNRVGLQDGGKACVILFSRMSRICEHIIESVPELKRKAFSISDIRVFEMDPLPEPLNKLKPVGKDRWVIKGHFHEGDERFPEEHRNKQATPTSIAAIAMAHVVDPSEWTPEDVDETLNRGDILYQNTMENLEKLGVSMDNGPTEEENEEEEEAPKGTLAAADVLNRFRISENDCIETEVLDSAYSGQLSPEPGAGVISLKDSLRQLFKEFSYAVVTARGGSTAVWKHDGYYYFFDPHGCDENGYPSDSPRAGAALVRMKGTAKELADIIIGNLEPGADDSFNISPVNVTATPLNPVLNAPETKLECKEFKWISKGTAAIMQGPRGENTAIGKVAEKAGIGEEDMAGRTLALPAAAAFTAATESVPPPFMHQDHMYNFLDAGAEYYLNFVKKTGRKEVLPEDLTEKFEMGANTFSIELGEPLKLPLWLPDEPQGEGEEGEKEMLEGEEEGETIKQIKDALAVQWNDMTKPTSVSLLYGDYHQLGVWMAAGGKVVVFDPAPTLTKGMLTSQRIKKGDEIRLQRIKDEMAGEDSGEPEDEEEEAGAEGEQAPEEPEFVPPESFPALMVFASPAEFLNKLVQQGGLDRKQCLAPYKLYPVKVTNDLTSVLKEKRSPAAKEGEDEGAAGDEEEQEVLVEPLEDEAIGKYFMRIGRATASLRGQVAQNENYFMDTPNRDHQDAANAAMGIVVDHIESYIHWKPALIDAILKYGDRLYTLSVPRASNPPTLVPAELRPEFHVTNFNVKLDVTKDVVVGDVKAADGGRILNIHKGIKRFFNENTYGIICTKGYCAAIWKVGNTFVYWDPHAVSPTGRTSPGGAAGIILFSNIDDLADIFKANVEGLDRPGPNKFCISSVKVFWEFSQTTGPVSPQGAIPDDGYEWKVLTGYVETAKGRTILRGGRPKDMVKFTRDSIMQSAPSAIVAASMAHIRRPHLWTKKIVDEIMSVGCHLFSESIASLGYEFRPAEDVLLPLQVLKRFVLGVNYIRYDLQQFATGRLEQRNPSAVTARSALERFFESHSTGILWSAPLAVAVWRVNGAPSYYMMEPHACGPTGLRIDAQDDGAACVLTFTSPKLMAFAYLQNIPVEERPSHEFQLYSMAINVSPIKKFGGIEPPLVRAPPGVDLVPATSKVGIDGAKRRASEGDRKHPPGSLTCLDAQRVVDSIQKSDTKLKGKRNTSGWLVLNDFSQFLSANHSMGCRKFSKGSRNNQALACSVMAVAMSKFEEVCRWCSITLDQILESGDQLYKDSFLHYKPEDTNILKMNQILRKFYTPGNCVCRVVIFEPRQNGSLSPSTTCEDFAEDLKQFFREEECGVFVANDGAFAVALLKRPRGYYMFDPADRDRYGRAVPPPCVGRARACFSQYPTVQALADKLRANIPPPEKKSNTEAPKEGQSSSPPPSNEDDEESDEIKYSIYGMEVTGLRRLNQHEK